MRKKETFQGYVEGTLIYEGTEVLSPKEIAKLTNGHSLELHLQGEDMKVNLILELGENRVGGNCVVEADIG